MFKFLVQLSLFSAIGATFEHHHSKVINEEISAIAQTSSNSRTEPKPFIHHEEVVNKKSTVPLASAHASSFSSRVDATGKPITYYNGIINEEVSVPLATGQSSSSSSTLGALDKPITYVPVVPVMAKSFEPKAVVAPVPVTRTVVIPVETYVPHPVPVIPTYGVNVAYNDPGLGYGQGYGYGHGYSYGHGYGYVQGYPAYGC